MSVNFKISSFSKYGINSVNLLFNLDDDINSSPTVISVVFSDKEFENNTAAEFAKLLGQRVANAGHKYRHGTK